MVYSKKARQTFDQIRSGDNQGGRSRDQNVVRIRTLFETFFYKKLNYSREKNHVRVCGRVCALYKLTLKCVCVCVCVVAILSDCYLEQGDTN